MAHPPNYQQNPPVYQHAQQSSAAYQQSYQTVPPPYQASVSGQSSAPGPPQAGPGGNVQASIAAAQAVANR